MQPTRDHRGRERASEIHVLDADLGGPADHDPVRRAEGALLGDHQQFEVEPFRLPEALGREDFDELAVPLAAVGRVDVVSRTKLYGGEANFVANLYRDECWNVDVFGGFRFLDLEESLDIATATSSARTGR